MTELFYNVLNISLTAGFVVLAVLLLRLIFKGTSRWISCLLWGLVALRLICPFMIESELSVIPTFDIPAISETDTEESMPVRSPVTFAESENAAGTSGVQNSVTDHTPESSADIGKICSVVWISGAAVMLIYGTAGYLWMRKRVSDSIPLRDNIRQSEKVESPFILGVFKPYIYIPFTLDKKTQKYVLAHEQAHLKRLDHVWKPLGFLLLAIHWFNPLMWIAYVLLCRDIEVACDEKVVRDFDLKARKAYATALLDCKVSRNAVAACPLAFGEVGVGERIKKTLKYKKPAMAIIVVAMILTLFVSVCLLTDPVSVVPDGYRVSSVRVTKGYVPRVPNPEAESSEEPTVPATEVPTEPATESAENESYVYTESIYQDYGYEDSDQIKVRTIPSNEEASYERFLKNVTAYGDSSKSSQSGSSSSDSDNTAVDESETSEEDSVYNKSIYIKPESDIESGVQSGSNVVSGNSRFVYTQDRTPDLARD